MSNAVVVRGELVLSDEAATRRLGAALAELLWPGAVVALYGRVGAGKTTLVQGMAAGLGVDEPVGSATFVLAAEYLGGRLPLHHIDLYRLDAQAAGELDMLDEYLFAAGVAVVEWADFIERALPDERIVIRLEDAVSSPSRAADATQGRRAVLAACGERADAALRKLVSSWPS